MMKKTIRTKVLAGVLAAICVASAATAISVVGVSAQSAGTTTVSDSKTIIVEKTAGSEFKLPLRGYDWNYYANSLNAKITCDFDYQKNICNFIITAVKPGITEATLKTQESDGKWSNTPIKITVNKDMTMKIEQNGNAAITDSDRTTGSSASTPGTSSPAETETPASAQTTPAAPKTGKTVHFPVKGTNWNYYANTLNAKITCDFDYSKSLCDFIITAVKPGVTDAVLKAKRTDGKWDNIPVHIVVDNELNLTVKQSGSTYVTEKSYTE